MKITGLEKLTRELDEAQQALAELDGQLGEVSYDPANPASIEAAIMGMEAMIDRRMEPYASNSIVAPIIESTKEHLRQSIIDQAQAHRLGRKDD